MAGIATALLLAAPRALGFADFDPSDPCGGGFVDVGKDGENILTAMPYDALWSVPKAVACLELMPLNTDIRDTVVSNIERGIGQAYTYADIARDSSQHVSSLDQCFDFDVHRHFRHGYSSTTSQGHDAPRAIAAAAPHYDQVCGAVLPSYCS